MNRSQYTCTMSHHFVKRPTEQYNRQYLVLWTTKSCHTSRTAREEVERRVNQFDPIRFLCAPSTCSTRWSSLQKKSHRSELTAVKLTLHLSRSLLSNHILRLKGRRGGGRLLHRLARLLLWLDPLGQKGNVCKD